MANLIWRGDAKPIAQVVKVTPSNPEAGDLFILEINGKLISFVATDTSVSTVVSGLVAAWGSATFPEATEVIATAVDSNDDGLNEYLTLTAATPGVPFKVKTSTIDAGGFTVDVSTIQQGSPGLNEIQRVAIPSSSTGGTFTLTFQGETTGTIAHDADAATVESALEALSNITAGDVIVTGSTPVWLVEFAQNYGAINVPALTGDGSSLSGSSTITHDTTTEGAGGTNEIKQFGSDDLPSGASTFTLTYPGLSSNETSPLHMGVSAGGMQSALEALATIGPGNVLVTKPDDEFIIEFIGDLGSQNIGDLTAIGDVGGSQVIPTVQQGSAGTTNEVQTITINGSPTGGTFTLTFQGQTTAAIAFDADVATVETALEALSNIDAVTVEKISYWVYRVTFEGSLAGTDVAQLTSDASNLTGGFVSVTTNQTSIPANNEFQTIDFSQPPGGGTFTLSWNAETTAPIAYNASAAAVQTALENLSTPGTGDFDVTGNAGGPWTVEFQATYAKTNVSKITGDGDSLTGGGAQDLSLVTTTRSAGPNHIDDPDNWTGGAVPNSLDALFYSGGKVHCLYGLKQRVTFTADAGTDTLTFAELADFVEGQAVRLFTTNTLPAGLATATTYYITNLDYDAGTCQLSLTKGGGVVNITDAGTGTHTIALHLSAIHFQSRWTGNLGLPDRNEAEYYEYRPRSLAIVADTITIGEGEGDGQSRLDLDTGAEPVTLIVHQSGSSNEAGLPAIRWIGNHADNAIVIHDGELGVAVYATEQATIDTLVQHAGLVQMGTVTLGGLTKHGGELIAENATLAGALKLHA